MRILIADVDLFRTVGGGQTFYRSVIRRHPDVEFWYLQDREPDDADRPENAHPVKKSRAYTPSTLADFTAPRVPVWLQETALDAANVAAAVAGCRFDVVDVPDYLAFGSLLGPALRRHDVMYRRLALSMHGRFSTSLATNWHTEGLRHLPLLTAEDLQYRTADLRYFISQHYREEWHRACDLPAAWVDPLWFFRFEPGGSYAPEPGPDRRPGLTFVGRTEKLKGPHVFLHLLWWLSPGLYRSATVAGPEFVGEDGIGSTARLRAMADNRGLRVKFRPSLPPAELSALFATNSLTVVPSFHDTLNLVGLESVLSGCPTAIGDGAGVCRYLHDRFPRLPFVMIPMKNPLECVPALENVLGNYESYRRVLARELEAIDRRPAGPGLMTVYRGALASDPEARDYAEHLYACVFGPPHSGLESRPAA